jgi:hypothetical protein
MSASLDLSEPLLGQELTIAQHGTVAAWGRKHRPNGLRIFVAIDHEAFPEVIEVSVYGSPCPLWNIWRDRTGCLRVDDMRTGAGSSFPGVAAALAHIMRKLGED